VDGPASLGNAWRALGEQLAAYRKAAGYSQLQLATLAVCSRSTIANVEIGRQHAPADFWRRVDEALDAGGALVMASEKIDAAVRQNHRDHARRVRPVLPGYDASEQTRILEAVGTGHVVQCEGRWGDLVAAAAEQARDQAMRMAVTEIGPGVAEQLRAEVARLSRAYVSAPPAPLFAAMGRVLGRVQLALTQRVYPSQARELGFLAGALCGLMANASLDLGREDAAEALAMAAWTYGRVIDHGPLMGWARGTQALAAIWEQRYLDAAERAADGLTHAPPGMAGARLHAIQARALAAAGERPLARHALQAAGRAYSEAHGDDLHHDLGGEFAFSEAKLWYYRALTFAEIGDLPQAGSAAEAAIKLYEQTPVRFRSYGCQALARVELARVHLKSSNLDEAAQALAGLFTLGPEMRISSLGDHLQALRVELRGPVGRQSRTARQLDQQLAEFTAARAARALAGG
jgi:DNA-binding XRE family transcriptional regulator